MEPAAAAAASGTVGGAPPAAWLIYQSIEAPIGCGQLHWASAQGLGACERASLAKERLWWLQTLLAQHKVAIATSEPCPEAQGLSSRHWHCRARQLQA